VMANYILPKLHALQWVEHLVYGKNSGRYLWFFS